MSFSLVTLELLKKKTATAFLALATLLALVSYTSLIPAANAASSEGGLFVANATPSLTVNAEVINDDGGSASVDDVTLYVDGEAVASGDENQYSVGWHTVTSSDLSGYEVTISGECDTDGSIHLASPYDSECTVTFDDTDASGDQPSGHITVQKVVVNDDGGTSVADDFDLYVNDTHVGRDARNVWFAGTYQISEQGDTLDQYHATFSGDCDADGVLVLSEDEDATCTITNDDIGSDEAIGSITLHKVVVNDDGGTMSADDFGAFVGDTQVQWSETNDFDAGSYQLSESNMDGYEASYSGDCDANGMIDLSADEDLVCTITNDDVADQSNIGYVTIHKDIVNDDGGPATVDHVTLSVGDTDVARDTENPFGEGWYVVSESGPIGYDATFSGDCDANGNLHVIAGEHLSCTITNDDIPGGPFPGTITVQKVVVNDNGGTSLPDDFDLYVNDTHVGRDTANLWNPGTYTISEQGDTLEQYAASFSGDCDENGVLVAEAGEDLVCTITNNDIDQGDDLGTITVIKQVVNDDDGEGIVSDFPLSVGDVSVTSGVSHAFAAGTYTVTEADADGYAATFSGDCNENGVITLQAGEDLVCTMTNDDVSSDTEDDSASLRVITHVINNDDGDADASDATIRVDGTNVSDSIFDGSESGVTISLDAGDYDVSADAMDGYDVSYSSDCDGSIDAGETLTCVVTLNDESSDNGSSNDDEDNDNDNDSNGGNGDVNVTVNTGDVNVTTGDVNVTTGDVVSDNDVVISGTAAIPTGGGVLGETSPPTTTTVTPPTGSGVLGEPSTLPRTGGFPISMALVTGLSGAYLITRRRS